MLSLKHTAITGENLSMKSAFIQAVLKGKAQNYFPELLNKKGVLFSNTTLAKFIDEEFLHEKYELTNSAQRSIRSYSSGEQKKALLNYLLSKNPDFIIVDNPFDALDVESVKNLKTKLTELSKKLPIIQVFKRRSDLLPFIIFAMHIENNKVVYQNTINNYLNTYAAQNPFNLKGEIPSPINKFELHCNELVSFKNVNVSYGDKQILQNISWQINPGEFWQLKGPNGSGKTTMLTMINGDNPKAFGEQIKLFGRQKGSGENVWQIKKLIGYFTPSMMELFKRRSTCEQMVVSGLLDSIGLYRKASDMQIHLAQKWLDLIGVLDRKDKPFLELSQVHQRMVLIARAMIKHPPLLILDEPSTGLDDYSASMLSTLINKMAAESATAILYVSHRIEPDLNPQYILELTPSKLGSTAKVISGSGI